MAKAIRELAKEGIEGIVIGDTCLNIELGNKSFEGDIDLFVTSMSPLLEADRIYDIAQNRGWSTGVTVLGTPSVSMTVNDEEVVVELFENVMDFYIPQELIDLCRQEYEIGGEKITCLAKECWIVLKARRGSDQDLAKLSLVVDLMKRNEIKIDKNKMKSAIEVFEDEAEHIYERLRNLGFSI
ncbi:MAG: nucleotidyltransferase [Ignisphaera sp.]